MFDLDFLLIMIAPHLVLGAAVLAVFCGAVGVRISLKKNRRDFMFPNIFFQNDANRWLEGLLLVLSYKMPSEIKMASFLLCLDMLMTPNLRLPSKHTRKFLKVMANRPLYSSVP